MSEGVKSEEWEEYMGKDVMIQRISPGDGVIAEMKSIVKANVKMFKVERNENNEVNLSLVEEMEGVSYQIGEGDAVPGLELSLRHSSKGESIRVRCSSKFGFGATPLVKPILDANSELQFDVDILEHSEDNGNPERIRLDIATRKESGNRWFAYGDFLRAGRCFTKGAQAAEKNLSSLATSTPGEPQTPLYVSVAQLYLDCLNNLAACHLNLKDPFKAREACIKVLEADPNNVRGLLRAGKASLGLHEYDESRMCFDNLLGIQHAILDKIKSQGCSDKVDVEKANADIQNTENYLKKLKKAEIAYKNRDKSIGKRIAKGLFEGKDQISTENASESLDSVKEELKKDTKNISVPTTSAIAPIDDSGSNHGSGCKTIDTQKRREEVNASNGDNLGNKTLPSETRDSNPESSPKSDLKKGTSLHPIVENLYTYQMYYYTAIFAASVAIGMQIL